MPAAPQPSESSELATVRAALAQTEKERSVLEHRLQTLSDGACDFLLRISAGGLVLEASAKTEALYREVGLQPVGSSLRSLFVDSESETVLEAVEAALRSPAPRTVRAPLPRHDDRWFEFAVSVIPAQGQAHQVLLTGQDISEFKRSEAALVHLATHDTLTALPNRALMEDRVRRQIEEFRRTLRPFTVVVMDLDGFKKVNDSLGHAAGDEVLKQTADRLTSLMRGTDTVARMGGDEFVLVLPGVGSATMLEPILGRVLTAIEQPYTVEQHMLYLTTSVGAAVYATQGDAVATVLSNADMAMYRAKSLGKNRWSLFEAQMRATTTQNVTLEAALYEGVRNGEFLLHYQPICDASTGRIAGVEALMRWQRPGYGLVPPDDFIPIAEGNGLINLLGAWALKVTAMQLAAWDAQGLAPVYASVNVSSRQFKSAHFVSEVRQALAISKVDPARLVLEITESVLMHDAESACKTLDVLVAMGLRIAIDDFGTGYSSLTYLKKFPLHALKIDRSFVQSLPDDANDAAIVNAILALARETDLQVIAEGVELESQRAYLSSKGCNFVQGWLTGRPVLPAAIADLLTQVEPMHELLSDTQ